MSRQARTRTSFFCLAFLLVGIPLWWLHTARSTAVVARSVEVPSTLPADFPATLIRAGLEPRALAAAGLSSQSVIAVLFAAAGQMNLAPTALSTADEAYAT